MPKKKDFYPTNEDALVLWHKVFSEQFANFNVKYGLSAADVAKAVAYYNWFVWVINLKNALRAFSQQVTKYFNDIAGKDPTKDPPSALADFDVGTAPPQPDPGIEFQIREWARQMKNHTDYSEADGEAMGIEGAEEAEPDTTSVEFTASTLANFELGVSFRKLGNDAVKFQFRYQGGQWQSAGFLVSSPGVLSIPPQVDGTGEQIEIRAIYMKGNNEVGTYSDAKTAFIAP
jgi:hypothetical protein